VFSTLVKIVQIQFRTIGKRWVSNRSQICMLIFETQKNVFKNIIYGFEI